MSHTNAKQIAHLSITGTFSKRGARPTLNDCLIIVLKNLCSQNFKVVVLWQDKRELNK